MTTKRRRKTAVETETGVPLFARLQSHSQFKQVSATKPGQASYVRQHSSAHTPCTASIYIRTHTPPGEVKKNRPLMEISSAAQYAVGVRRNDLRVQEHRLLKYMLLYPGHISVSMEDTPVKNILHGSALYTHTTRGS